MLDLVGVEEEPGSAQTPSEKEEVAAADEKEKKGEEEKPEEQEEVKAAAEEEVVKEEKPKEEPGEPEPKPGEVEEIDWEKRTKLAQEKLEKVAARMLENLQTLPAQVDVPGAEKPAAEAKPSEPAKPTAITDLVDEETYERLMQDRGAFNEFMASVVAKMSNTARTDAVTDILRMLPGYNAKQRGQERVLEAHISDFWNKNKDLKPISKTVGLTCTDVEAEHPDWKIEDVLEETEKRVRNDLALQARVKEGEAPEGEKATTMPKLTSTRKPPAKQKEGLAKEMEDLVEGIPPGGILQ